MERRITALKAQKRNRNRVSVYLDGGYAFGLSRIVAAWLSVGQELGEEKIEELQEQDAFETAYQGALKLIDYRMRSAKEIEGHLKRKGIPEETVSAVMERLKRSGLVNDGTFAESWVENRVDFRPRSRRVLRLELRQKGVPEEEIQAALEGIDSEEELAYRAAEKYIRKANDIDKETFRQKLGGYLARKGFSYSTASQAIERIWTERGSNGSPEC